MPFTPLHMGPGILIKALLQGSFSLMVFGWSQIVMDLQPLFVMITGEGQLHGFSHTFIGATLIAVISALTGKYLSELGLKILDISKRDNPVEIIWWIAFSSAFIGTYSHVILDGIMHSDVAPYYPFTSSNSFLGILSIDALHKVCIYTGIIGAGIYYLIQFRFKKQGAL